MPKVSIIIPVYNVEQYLRQCLDSVTNQTLKDIEIICVNDCSPDNSLSILQEYAKIDNRIRIIDLKENGGPGNARNIALSLVSSNYVIFLDSDDWLELNACEIAYNQIYMNKNDFVMFGLFDYFDHKNKMQENLSKIKIFYDTFGQNNFSTRDIDFPFLENAFCCFKIYNTEFLLKNDIKFCTTLYEDNLFNVKLYNFATSISVIYKPLYYYRRREGSITQNASTWGILLEKKKNVIDLSKKYCEVNPWFIKSALVASINSIIAYYKRFSRLNKSIKEDFFNEIHCLFINLNQQYDINTIKEYIDYHEFTKIERYTFIGKKMVDLLESIFSIYKVRQIVVLRFCGIKLKVKNS